MTKTSFDFAGARVRRGSRKFIELPAGRLPSGTELSIPVQVVRGSAPGPAVWLSGAIHGDEIVGVEVIRQVVEQLDPKAMAGTVVAAPVVNVFGFVAESRYLPDRRDLNRSFPGSKRGPLAGRLARLFLDEVVSVCEIGLDFHAGSDDRTNIAQIRGDMTDAETHRLAVAFGAPILIHSNSIKGTLRQVAVEHGKKVLLFEGGEPRRFNPDAVNAGVVGTLRVLGALDMIDDVPPPPEAAPKESAKTYWVRATRGGIFRLEARLGAVVEKRDRLGVIAGPAGRGGSEVRARDGGMIIGHAVNPLVHQGDGLVHIAEFSEKAFSPAKGSGG